MQGKEAHKHVSDKFVEEADDSYESDGSGKSESDTSSGSSFGIANFLAPEPVPMPAFENVRDVLAPEQGLQPGSSSDHVPASGAGLVGPPVGALGDDGDALSDVGEPAPVVPSRRAAPSYEGFRETRQLSWGIFKLAPVFSKGNQIGWGATCGRHHNWSDVRETTCKVQLVFGTVNPISNDECRWRVKMWCFAGLDIEDGSPTGRTEHLGMKARTVGLTRTEDQLDEMLGYVIP